MTNHEPALEIAPPIPFTVPNHPAVIALVGCGGTGGYALTHIAQLAYHMRALGLPETRIIVIDGDVVEEKNILRQNFYPRDIGRNKAEVLAFRASADFGLAIEAIPTFATAVLLERLGRELIPAETTGILVGAVDNAAARRAIHDALSDNHSRWSIWIDAGNEGHAGVVVAGTATTAEGIRGALALGGVCGALPAVNLLYPDILRDPPKSRRKKRTDCADAVAANEQSLMINKEQAIIIGQYLNQLLIERKLTTFWTSTNLVNHSRMSVTITAENLQRAIGISIKDLTTIPQAQKRARRKRAA
jgi:PRTRC genetic system ThiF family protein